MEKLNTLSIVDDKTSNQLSRSEELEIKCKETDQMQVSILLLLS